LLSIGEDDQHSVAIYDWASQSKLCDASVDLAQVYDARWSNDDNMFATCGVKHMKIFRQNGQNLQGSQCNYSSLPKGEQLTSINYVLNNQLLSGSSSGQLVPWNGNAMGKPIKAHTAPIWCIEKGANNTFYTGANDGKVILWNAQM
jgi:microtubule-associated protein-like 6